MKWLLLLLSIFCLLKVVFHAFDGGHDTSYYIGNYKISEKLDVRDNNNYYFVLSNGDFKINFQIFYNFGKASNVIKKVYYGKSDGYTCVLPEFKGGRILTDVMCLGHNSNELILYHNLGKSFDFVSKFPYSSSKYVDKAKGKSISNSVSVYSDNFIRNHYLAMENYRGLSLFNSSLSSSYSSVKLFNSDVYTRGISYFFDKYYITADYNSQYTFNKFYVVNLVNGNMKEIRSYSDISFDSYIEGYYDGNVYLFDRENKCQYVISIDDETVKRNENIMIYDGKFHSISLNDALNGKLFYNYSVSSKFEHADLVGNYYYFYKKSGDKYLVYRADRFNKSLITYVFTTSDFNSVSYVGDYVYYVLDDGYYYYGRYGTRRVLVNNEKEFNKEIKFGVYVK